MVAFGNAISGRGTNDSMNADRELAIEMLFSRDQAVRDLLLRISPDRSAWAVIRRECETAINGFMSVGADGVPAQQGHIESVEKVGGRSKNFDFEGKFETSSGREVRLKIELKRGESIYDQPQFLQLYARDGEMVTSKSPSYAEWFYDNYLKTVVRLAGTSTPPKQEYLRKCCGTNYEVFPHTKVLYGRLEAGESAAATKLKEIAYESIDSYLAALETRPELVDLAAIQARLDQQIGKLFLSWDPIRKKFAVEVFSTAAMRLSGAISFKRRPTGERSCLVVTNQAGHPIEALLRWKNRSCLLGPAWQISLKSA